MPASSLAAGFRRSSNSPRFWLPRITRSRGRCGEAASRPLPPPLPARLLLPLLPALSTALLPLLRDAGGCSTASTCASAWLPSRTRCCVTYACCLLSAPSPARTAGAGSLCRAAGSCGSAAGPSAACAAVIPGGPCPGGSAEAGRRWSPALLRGPPSASSPLAAGRRRLLRLGGAAPCSVGAAAAATACPLGREAAFTGAAACKPWDALPASACPSSAPAAAVPPVDRPLLTSALCASGASCRTDRSGTCRCTGCRRERGPCSWCRPS